MYLIIKSRDGDKVQEIIEKANAVLEKYSEQLEDNGIKVTVSKRYFEESVDERIGNTGNTAIFNEIDRALDRKREKRVSSRKKQIPPYHSFCCTYPKRYCKL